MVLKRYPVQSFHITPQATERLWLFLESKIVEGIFEVLASIDAPTCRHNIPKAHCVACDFRPR